MGKLSSISSREAVRAFTNAGFYVVAQQGTLRKGILRPIGMSEGEFIRWLKK